MLEPYLTDGIGGLLDVGAGSGRIAIPVAGRGNRVTAVDPSGRMLDRLDVKARLAGVRDRIAIVHRPIEAVSPADQVRNDHDASLCAFSAIHHLLDPRTLHEAFRSIASALRIDGNALVGVHPPEVFFSYRHGVTDELHLPCLDGVVRWIQTLDPGSGNDSALDYRNTLVLPDGRTIEDRFPLRPWSISEVIAASVGSGLVHEDLEGLMGNEHVLRFRRVG